MTRVAWHFDTVVLNHILLDDGVADSKSRGLRDSLCVEVGLGDESIVAWDVGSGLRSSHGQLVVLVRLVLGITGQFVARVVPISTHRFLELSLEVASLRGVCLARVRPYGSLRHGDGLRHLLFIRHLRVSLPVLRSVADLGRT